uniref:(northern house mosquito) hypothetical protein n=1 Tax=Culex pipiens TaxID=7175 RepID=A0A8D8ICX1_CULPI
MLLLLLVVAIVASPNGSPTNGPGPTILLWSGRNPKASQLSCGGHRSRGRRRGGRRAGTDLLVNVGHFQALRIPLQGSFGRWTDTIASGPRALFFSTRQTRFRFAFFFLLALFDT